MQREFLSVCPRLRLYSGKGNLSFMAAYLRILKCTCRPSQYAELEA